MNRPLDGITIAEAASPESCTGERLALALAGRIAADLGATVIKIEPVGGDPLRRMPPLVGETGALFAFVNAGKKSVVSTGGDVLRRIIRRSDAVLAGRSIGENLRSDVAIERKADTGAALVLVSMLGREVPSTTPASEFTVLALGGVLDIVGDPAREPLRLGGHQAAYAAGLAAYTGLAAALCLPNAGIERRSVETVHVSLLETAIWLNWKSIAIAATGGNATTRSGQAGDWPIVRCADGWVALVYLDGDWARLRELTGNDARLDDPRLATLAGRQGRNAEIAAIMEEHFAMLTRRQIHDLAVERRLPLGAVATVSETVEDPHIIARNFIRFSRCGQGQVPMPRLPLLWDGEIIFSGKRAGSRGVGGEVRMRKPLEGCRVLDLGIITAGAATSALLADLGAEVIKVESPAYRDPFRGWSADDPSASDLPSFFRYTNRNKAGVSLDLKQQEGRDAFFRLVRESDVVVENFRRGVMRRLGIDYPVLKTVRGDIIFAALSSQGETGPDADYVSYGTTLEAMAGLSWLTGYADGGPVASGRDLNYPDQVVAIFAAGMIVTAWLQRQRTGRGAHLDVSQRELTGFLIGEAFVHPRLQRRQGNAEECFAMQDCFQAKDGWVAVSVLPGEIHALESLLPPGEGGRGHRIISWMAARTRDEAVQELTTLGIAAAPVLSGNEVLANRGRSWEFAIAADSDGNLFKGFPFQLQPRAMTISRDAPHIGADTERVLREIAGYTQAEIDLLKAKGAIECSGKTQTSSRTAP